MITARVLSPGAASGIALPLAEPLSFWGGFDPKTGTIIDVHHPQRGACLTARVVLMAETRGSGTASGAIAEAIRRSTAPSAIITIEPDIAIAVGASVAQVLYGRACPVLTVNVEGFGILSKSGLLAISTDGVITAVSP
jgi:predicted aconitase with swiveling domain